MRIALLGQVAKACGEAPEELRASIPGTSKRNSGAVDMWAERNLRVSGVGCQGWLSGLVVRMVGWLYGWLIGWLVGWLVDEPGMSGLFRGKEDFIDSVSVSKQRRSTPGYGTACQAALGRTGWGPLGCQAGCCASGSRHPCSVRVRVRDTGIGHPCGPKLRKSNREGRVHAPGLFMSRPDQRTFLRSLLHMP
eukprot:365151-Chlamydomonas_euryale.AAC.6